VLSDDLRLVDADTLERIVLLPPGEGGEFYYAPDGGQAAVVTAGTISLIDGDGGNRDDVFTYTPVDTGSEYRYYARPAWATDSKSLQVVIPPANPHVSTTEPVQETTIWRIPADGSPASLSASVAVPLPLHAPIAFSDDLNYVAYVVMQQPEEGSAGEMQSWLQVARLEDGSWISYPGATDLYGWAPDAYRFAFLAGRQVPQLQIGEWSAETVPGSSDAGIPIYDVRWVDADHYLFVVRRDWELGAEGDGWELILGNVDGSSTVLASAADYLRYDFVNAQSATQVAGPSVTPIPSATPEPSVTVTPFVTPTPYPTPTPSATPTSFPRQVPTPTPVAPLPGLIYRTGDGLWKNVGPQVVQVFDRADALLSPAGTQVLYAERGGGDLDLWLVDLVTGARRNLTDTPDRVEAHFRWWPARPGVVLFSSRPQEIMPAPGVTGFLATVDVTSGGYRVLDDQNHTGGPPAPSPDGQTVAYGSGSAGWLYDWETGPEAFDPVDSGLAGYADVRIGSPAWSPDGGKLAWVVGGRSTADGSNQMGVAVFDLEARTARVLHAYEPVGGDGWPAAPVWSPDGRWLAFVAWARNSEEAGVWVVRADGQQDEEGREEEGAHHLGGAYPVWSPDGRWLVFGRTLGDGEVRSWLAWEGTWTLHRIDLPADAYVVDWVGQP
jgi:Tol biopolymer transport system component